MNTPTITDPELMPGPSISKWRKVIPNVVTCSATFTGMSSFYFGLNNDFKIAVFCIFLSALLDGLDGPIARYLNGTSNFGAELDSLSDYVNFGVSPAILIYFFSLKQRGYFGWVICLIYIISIGCRLARFNAKIDFNATPFTKSFFMGVPSPAAAVLVLAPLALSFFLEEDIISVEVFMVWILIVSFLAVSQIPTFSSKMLHLPKQTAVRILIFVVSIPVLFLWYNYFWLMLTIWNVGYFFSFFLSYFDFKSKMKKYTQSQKKK